MSASILKSTELAALAIQGGDYAASNKLLCGALRQIRRMQETGDDSLSTVSMCIDSVLIHGIAPDALDADVFYFFNRALILKQDSESGPLGDGEIACAKVASVIMYNLGLTFQIMAAKTGSLSHQDKALSFYQGAMSVAQHASLADEDVLVVLALANNMGCMFATDVNFDGASHCLSMIKDFYEAVDGSTVLSHEDAVFFSFTCFLYPNWQLVAAPMA